MSSLRWAEGRYGARSDPTLDEQSSSMEHTTGEESDEVGALDGREREWSISLRSLRRLYLDDGATAATQEGLGASSLQRKVSLSSQSSISRRARRISHPSSSSINQDWSALMKEVGNGNANNSATSRNQAPNSPVITARPESAQSRRSAHARHPAAGPSSGHFDEDLKLSDVYRDAPLIVHPRMSQVPFPAVRKLLPAVRKRILVTGGAGFLGSHLVDRLMIMGHDVMVLDNFFTGEKSNVKHWIGHPNFEMVRHDVVNPFMVEVDQIYHLACPASPQHYQANQIKTIKTNFLGTSNMLGLAKRTKARFLLASTSEVYGDPDVSPQKESYNGNVNQTGPRACYDEGKRVAETLTYGYLYQDDVDVRVARIFNTYGPRVNPFDGRVMSNFLIQALKGQPLTVYGDGSQTRSFCFIHDLIDGLIALMNVEDKEDLGRIQDPAHDKMAGVHLPVNLGNSTEFTIRQLVNVIFEVVDGLRKEGEAGMDQVPIVEEEARVRYLPMPVDDPRQRRPDITRAYELLGWQPRWNLRDGIREMALYYLQQMQTGLL